MKRVDKVKDILQSNEVVSSPHNITHALERSKAKKQEKKALHLVNLGGSEATDSGDNYLMQYLLSPVTDCMEEDALDIIRNADKAIKQIDEPASDNGQMIDHWEDDGDEFMPTPEDYETILVALIASKNVAN